MVKKVIKKDEPKNTKPKCNCSDNLFIYLSIALGVLLIAAIVIAIIGFTSKGNSEALISEQEASNKVLGLLEKQGVSAKVAKIETDAGLYKLTLEVQGQQLPLYVSKDGKYIIENPIPIKTLEEYLNSTKTEDNLAPKELEKTEKPEVELYIWSYCPYGVQAQEPLAEVANLFGETANFKAILYHDGHGAYETQQNKIQACIQKYDENNYWDYASEFVKTIYPVCGANKDIACDLEKSTALMNTLKIDSKAILECVETEGQTLIDIDRAKAASLGVTGSPTLVVNGTILNNVSRNADSFKTAVCDAFLSAPETCGVELDASQTAAAGNC
jgi:hypothetical protein